MMTASENLYLPNLARVAEIVHEVRGPRAIDTFRLDFPQGGGFDHQIGQCAMLSVFGKGEVMISIASTPLIKEYKQFSVMRLGKVTAALHDVKVGDFIGVRGPYGNSFPIADWKGKNLIVIAGGVGLAPVWPIVQTAIAQGADFGRLTVFYGGRTSRDLMYRAELEKLRGSADIHLSIDSPENGWNEFCGYVPANVADKKVSPENTIAITCGPPVMIKAVIDTLKKQGFSDEAIYTTIENKMKCGVGKCGRCNVGKDYVCVSGPVYSWAALRHLPDEY